MKSRWLAIIVCVLYASISTVFAAVHHHDGESADANTCVACAWHHHSEGEIPQGAFRLERPALALTQARAPHLPALELFSHSYPSRGPPAVSL